MQGDTTTSGAEACWAECEAELGASRVAVDAWEDSFLYDFEGVSGSEEERAAAPSCMLHFAKAACEGEASCEWLSSFGGRCREVTGGVTPGAPTSKPSAEPTRSPAPTLEPTVPPTYFAGYKCFCQDKCDCMYVPVPHSQTKTGHTRASFVAFLNPSYLETSAFFSLLLLLLLLIIIRFDV